LEILLDNVKRLKRGIPSELPEFYGFANWHEVVEHVEQEHDEGLRLLVKLVNQYGEERLLQALRSCVDSEDKAQIIASTAHKAKGCEWDVVQIDRDFDSVFTAPERPEEPGMTKRDLDAEGRLFYVAMTRAKSAVELPPGAMLFFGITNSRSEHFGTPYVPETHQATRSATARASTFSQTRPMAQSNRTQYPRSHSGPTDKPQSSGDGVVSKLLKALFGK
jgi:ATP-dependent exoDNAse (exonuclease V) beta subunit